MTVTGIDHVQVAAPAGCEAEARAFYGELLGLEELPKPDALAARGGCWFRAGAQELHVGVDDLDALATRLLAAGIEPSHDATIPDTTRFYAVDPFGNRLEFRQA